MEFLFNEPGIKDGHVQFKTEGRSARIEVSVGRGSETQVHLFRVQGEIPPPAYDTNSATNLCRIAIAKYLLKRGAFASMEYIDERATPWGGKLTPLD